MDLGGILILLFIAGCVIYACIPPNQEREKQKAIKQQKRRLKQALTQSRYPAEELHLAYPDGFVVMTYAQRHGLDWHAILAPFSADSIMTNAPPAASVIACTGEQVEPFDLIPMNPCDSALFETVNCPYCTETMTRLYSFNQQPYSARNMHPQHQQLLMTPAFVAWNTTPLQRPSRRKQKTKQPVKQSAQATGPLPSGDRTPLRYEDLEFPKMLEKYRRENNITREKGGSQ